MSDPAVIAIIEDDEAVREALSELLQVLGFSCRTFERAEAFLEVWAPGTFACLISDIRLPGMSGIDLLQKLNSGGSRMPAIVISSLTDPTTRQRAIDAGAHVFMMKPISADALIVQLEAALGRNAASGSK